MPNISKFPITDGTLVISAANLNKMVDSINKTTQSFNEDYGKLFLKNSSGVELTEPFSIVGLGESLFNPQTEKKNFFEYLYFDGLLPDADLHSEKFAILKEAASVDESVRGINIGLSPVQVLISEENHQYAVVSTGVTSHLVSAGSGTVKILWKESGTGLKWAVVQINQSSGLPYLYKTTTNESNNKINAKKLNSAGLKTGDEEQFITVPVVDE